MDLWRLWKKITLKTTGKRERSPERDSAPKKFITIEALKKELADIDDAVFVQVPVLNQTVTVVYINSLSKVADIHELVIRPLREAKENQPPSEILPLSEEVELTELPAALIDIVSGFTLIHFENPNKVIKLNTYNPAQRSITPTDNESTVIGPQDAFTESLETNVSLIKRRILNPSLKYKQLVLGTETRTSVAVLYIEDIANPEIVKRVLERLHHVEYHGYLSMSHLSKMIEDHPFSPFPQLAVTQRPDHVTAALLDGRIAVMLNGSPEATICPVTFLELFMSSEDYYLRWTVASLLRSLRFFGFFVSVFLTSSYVSVLTYHQEMLPPQLLLLLSESRARVPFPPVIEALAIELVVEILREAGSRMPSKVGQTIGIVGGIVIGTASVEAGLTSNVLIVLVSVSALLSFLPASYLLSTSGRFLRYFFILAASLLGLFGQMLALAAVMVHLLRLTSVGEVYMTPVIPRKLTDLEDSIFLAPIKYMLSRSGASKSPKKLRRPLDEE